MQPELTLGQALDQGAKLLADAGIVAPRLTAEVLLAHALGRDRTYLMAHSPDRLPELAWIHYGRWLHERIGGKPTQYITRKQEFFGREFEVALGVLIPRPETEHVIERALELPVFDGPIVDAGTGSGCIAITLSLELRRRVFAFDVMAPSIARRNAARLGADVLFWRGDWLTALRSAALIVSNPPYIPWGDVLAKEVGGWEPGEALFSGVDGLDAWRSLIAQTPNGAWLIGEIDARAAMLPLFDSTWDDIEVRNDLAGLPRVLSARRRP